MVIKQGMVKRVVTGHRVVVSSELKRKLKDLGNKIKKAPEYFRKLMDSMKEDRDFLRGKRDPSRAPATPLVWVDPKTLKIDEARALQQVEQMSSQQVKDVLKQTEKIMGMLAYEASS